MPFSIPNSDDCLENLHGAKIFISLDLAHCYLQIPLEESAMDKTAFITCDDTGEFTRAMFGLMNAPFYCAKLMKKIFYPVRHDVVINFFDDMLIFANLWHELMKKFLLVLEVLNIKKCRFGMREIEFLGLVNVKLKQLKIFHDQ